MKVLFTLGVLLICLSGSAHKYFISIASMEYNEEKKRIDVSLKMTAHDFEKVLIRKFERELHIEKIEDDSEIGKYCQAYIRQNFTIHSDDQQAEFNYLGKEIDNREDLYFYFSFVNIKNPSSLNVASNLLFSISDDQQNIVHYKYKDQTKSVTLLPSQNSAKIIF